MYCNERSSFLLLFWCRDDSQLQAVQEGFGCPFCFSPRFVDSVELDPRGRALSILIHILNKSFTVQVEEPVSFDD